jgi:hypothetical protein
MKIINHISITNSILAADRHTCQRIVVLGAEQREIIEIKETKYSEACSCVLVTTSGHSVRFLKAINSAK